VLAPVRAEKEGEQSSTVDRLHEVGVQEAPVESLPFAELGRTLEPVGVVGDEHDERGVLLAARVDVERELQRAPASPQSVRDAERNPQVEAGFFRLLGLASSRLARVAARRRSLVRLLFRPVAHRRTACAALDEEEEEEEEEESANETSPVRGDAEK
jgi:hypothetical protein